MKKVLSLVLSALFLCSFATTNVFADNNTSTKEGPYIEARYSDFSMVFATLHLKDNGFYEISGGAASYKDILIEVTVTLEACGSDGVYRPVDGFEWNGSGYASALTSATRDLPGGSYRTHTYAKCSLNGTVLESVNAYSDVVFVPY
ncbi:hypothetical protein [uncultured Subdoligranulum sp.]|uniref:hypothetical protein n=1 Tax=uncultured Subdoligranulum sp. TaxID=512298 RepID=UPI0025E1505C|nr:hypothetical protein [uncultured Subdoligranulum sp.]